jgi:hypothetical protein
MNNNISIENWTNYSMLLRKSSNLNFEAIRKHASAFITNLSDKDRDELFDKMNRGILPLGSEPEMSMYMYAYGKMHYMKLLKAFESIDKSVFDSDLEIIDYGCGQALGVIAIADYLKSIHKTPNIKSITLLEPSKLTLNRAVLHTSILFPNVPTKAINKEIDDLVKDDFITENENTKLHIFSNILDVESFHLENFANLVDNSFTGYNLYLCVSPYFGENDSRYYRVDEFKYYFKNISNEHSVDLGRHDWIQGWTCSIRIFYKGELSFNNKKKPFLNERIYFNDHIGSDVINIPIRNITCKEFSKEFLKGEKIRINKNSKTGKFYLTHASAKSTNPEIGKVSENLQSVESIRNMEKPMMCLLNSEDGDAVWYLYDSKYFENTLDDNVGNDFNQSINLIKNADLFNDIQSKYELANCYFYGKGVSQDFIQAIYLYREAAEKGYSKAEEKLGYLHLEGIGVPQNFLEAIKWFKRAEEHGSVDAQNKLKNYIFLRTMSVVNFKAEKGINDLTVVLDKVKGKLFMESENGWVGDVHKNIKSAKDLRRPVVSEVIDPNDPEALKFFLLHNQGSSNTLATL